MRVAFYARVSTHDQQTLPLQLDAMRAYAAHRGWDLAVSKLFFRCHLHKASRHATLAGRLDSAHGIRLRADLILEQFRLQNVSAVTMLWRIQSLTNFASHPAVKRREFTQHLLGLIGRRFKIAPARLKCLLLVVKAISGARVKHPAQVAGAFSKSKCSSAARPIASSSFPAISDCKPAMIAGHSRSSFT